ncbi:MAG TPA: hypothetical protein PLQ49_02015 [Methanothrix sp.]|nr:hypothetical protein [Methanothrix sp.]
MKLRYMAIMLAIIIFGTISANCSDYRMIGKGGPNLLKVTDADQFNYSIKSYYQIIDGLPDLSDFQLDHINISEENRTIIRDYIRSDTIPTGHIFEFQGQLKVGDCEFKGPLGIGEYTYCIRRFDEPAEVIMENLSDVTCTQNYREPLKCSISKGYLVDHDGNLHRMEGLTLIPDAKESGWKYHGFGYLVRVQNLTNASNSLAIPDQGGYVINWDDYYQPDLPYITATISEPVMENGEEEETQEDENGGAEDEGAPESGGSDDDAIAEPTENGERESSPVSSNMTQGNDSIDSVGADATL